MPSGPSLFDDLDDDSGRATSSGSDVGAGAGAEPVDQSTRRTPISERDPNYLIRRAIVVGVVVAFIAVAAIVVGRIVGSGSNSSTQTGTAGAEWNRVVLVDDRTGRVIVDDGAGEEVARVESGVRSPTATETIGPTLLVAGAASTAVVDLETETTTPFELADATIVQPSGSALTMVATSTTNDRGIVVHGPSGDTIDTEAFATVVGARYQFAEARTGPSGRDVLVTDSGNFQSVLFSFDRDAASFFPGLALAVGDNLVVTAQNVGTDATVSIFDHDGTPVTTGRTPSVRAAMITDNAVLLATVDGDLVAMDPSSGDTETKTSLGVGSVRSGHVTPDGDRFIVEGVDGTVIVDTSGTVVETFDGQYPAGDDPVPRGAVCITLRDDGDPAERRLSVVDTTDGSVLVEAIAESPLGESADGCVVASPTSDGYALLSAAGFEQFDNGDTIIALAPDGATVVVERGNRIQLVAVATPDTGDSASADDPEPIDLGPRGRSVGFFRS